jgi:3-phosphoshikimate 1-carboxyvinyltransferase
VPGDKSISHRALILSALTVGETRITGLLEGEDVINTSRAMRALGATVERTGEGAWRIHGVGVSGFAEPSAPLDFGNSGTGCRLVIGAVAGCPVTATFDGDASLRSRPMQRFLDPLARMGAHALSVADGGRLPLTLQGARDPIPIVYRPPAASAQLKSAVLLAGLAAPGETVVIEQEASRDHTERMLRHFGAEVRVVPAEGGGKRITVVGWPELLGRDIVVPGDPSSAAFAVVAAAIRPGSDITVENVGLNPLRAGLYQTLLDMGADIAFENEREVGGEPVADLHVKGGVLKGIDVPAERAPSMIDEYPILAVAAAFARGRTTMRGLAELRVKESDRLAAVAEGLKKCGAKFEIGEDWLAVEGAGGLAGGGTVATNMDHRIAMAFLIAGLASKAPIKVDDTSFVATSFPTFMPAMRQLGAQFRVDNR